MNLLGLLVASLLTVLQGGLIRLEREAEKAAPCRLETESEVLTQAQKPQERLRLCFSTRHPRIPKKHFETDAADW